MDTEIWVVSSTASQEQPFFVKINQPPSRWPGVFLSLGSRLIGQHSSTHLDPHPASPMRPGHRPRGALGEGPWDLSHPESQTDLGGPSRLTLLSNRLGDVLGPSSAGFPVKPTPTPKGSSETSEHPFPHFLCMSESLPSSLRVQSPRRRPRLHTGGRRSCPISGGLQPSPRCGVGAGRLPPARLGSPCAAPAALEPCSLPVDCSAPPNLSGCRCLTNFWINSSTACH